MFKIIGLLRLAMQAILLGAQIYADEKLRNSGRQEVALENANDAIKVLREYQRVDAEIGRLTADDIFDRLRAEARANGGHQPARTDHNAEGGR